MKTVLIKRVAYHETDCMGVVHHSNYLKFFEEARVELLHQKKLEGFHSPHYDYVLAVLNVELKFIKPLKLSDEFEVRLSSKMVSSLKFEFSYEIYKADVLCTTGKTLHVGLNSELDVVKPPLELAQNLK